MNTNDFLVVSIVVLLSIIAIAGIYYFFFSENKEKIALEYLDKRLALIKAGKLEEMRIVDKEFLKKYPKFMEKGTTDTIFGRKYQELLNFETHEKNVEASKLIAPYM